jgi:hypothetical protein
MYSHHEQTIQNVVEHFTHEPGVQALLLAGSIAHGFESADSDVDILIVVTEEMYQEKVKSGKLTYIDVSMAAYEGGYIDGKYLAPSFIRQVAEKGSEPARYAFKDARVLFSKLEGLEEEVRAVVKYPVQEKEERVARFAAQFAAWKWYCGEAIKKQNKYLLGVAISKMVLFGGRLVLAQNEMLYPFHKWLLAELQRAPEKPEGMLEAIECLHVDPTVDKIETFFQLVKGFRDWDESLDWNRWGSRFVKDVELTWMEGCVSVDEV